MRGLKGRKKRRGVSDGKRRRRRRKKSGEKYISRRVRREGSKGVEE